jgi:hypothetical protein
MSRRAMIAVIVGRPATGKTTLVKELCKINSRNLIFASNMSDKAFKGFGQIYCPTDAEIDTCYNILKTFTKGNLIICPDKLTDLLKAKKIFQNIARYFSGGGIFIDDAKTWIISKGMLDIKSEKVLIDARHKMTDVFFCFHSFKDVLGDIIKMECSYFIKKTGSQLTKSKLAYFDEDEQKKLIEIVNFVNSHPEQYITRVLKF